MPHQFIFKLYIDKKIIIVTSLKYQYHYLIVKKLRIVINKYKNDRQNKQVIT